MGNTNQRAARRRASEDDETVLAYSYLHGQHVVTNTSSGRSGATTPKRSRRAFSLSRGGGRDRGRPRSHTVVAAVDGVDESSQFSQFSPSTTRKIEAIARLPLKSANSSYGGGSGLGSVGRHFAKKPNDKMGKRAPLPKFGSLPDYTQSFLTESDRRLSTDADATSPSASASASTNFAAAAIPLATYRNGGWSPSVSSANNTDSIFVSPFSSPESDYGGRSRGRSQSSFPMGSLSRSRGMSITQQQQQQHHQRFSRGKKFSKKAFNRDIASSSSSYPKFSSPPMGNVNEPPCFSSQASSPEGFSPDASSPSFLEDTQSPEKPSRVSYNHNRTIRVRPAPPPRNGSKSSSAMISPSLSRNESIHSSQCQGRNRARSQTTLQRLKSSKAFHTVRKFRSRSPIKISNPISAFRGEKRQSDVVINIGNSPQNKPALQRSNSTSDYSKARAPPAAPFSNPTSTRKCKWANGEQLVAFEKVNNELKDKLSSVNGVGVKPKATVPPFTRPSSANVSSYPFPAAAMKTAVTSAHSNATRERSLSEFPSINSKCSQGKSVAFNQKTLPRLRVRPPPPPRNEHPKFTRAQSQNQIKPSTSASAATQRKAPENNNGFKVPQTLSRGNRRRPVSMRRRMPPATRPYGVHTLPAIHVQNSLKSASFSLAKNKPKPKPVPPPCFSAQNSPVAPNNTNSTAQSISRHSTMATAPSTRGSISRNSNGSNSSVRLRLAKSKSQLSRRPSASVASLSRGSCSSSRRPRAPTPAMFQQMIAESGVNVLGRDSEVTLQIGSNEHSTAVVVQNDDSKLRQTSTPTIVVEPTSLTTRAAAGTHTSSRPSQGRRGVTQTRPRSVSDAAPAAPVNSAKEYEYIPVPTVPAPPRPIVHNHKEAHAASSNTSQPTAHSNTRSRATSAYTTTSTSKASHVSRTRTDSVHSQRHKRQSSLSTTHNSVCSDPTLAPYWPSEATLRAPPMPKLLRGFSVLIWDQITLNTQSDSDEDERVGRVGESELREEDLRDGVASGPQFVKGTQWQKGNIPSFREIHRYVCALYKKSRPSWECVVLAGVFVHRLVLAGRAPMITRDNWVSVVFTANMVSQKYQDDECWKNVDFGNYPMRMYTDEQVNSMEALFLDTLNWDCYVSLNEYKKYFTSLLYFADVGAPKTSGSRAQRA